MSAGRWKHKLGLPAANPATYPPPDPYFDGHQMLDLISPLVRLLLELL